MRRHSRLRRSAGQGVMQTRSISVQAVCCLVLAFLLANCAASTRTAFAISIEWKEGATARMERRNAVREGRLQLPLPNTPDTSALPNRIAAMGLSPGASALIRVFKEESELEIWMHKDGVYVHFATYPICYWSGTSGPKLREGDRQTPEGFYTITSDQLHGGGRWPRSLNIGFPNAYDRAHQRSGSYILVHGGCDSVGCFAMTNAVNAEIYDLVSASLRLDTLHVPVQVFPFRLSEENLAAHATDPWIDFWKNLKQGYDSFERTRLPPRISVCEGSYRIEDAVSGEGHRAGPITMCPTPSVASAEGIPAPQPGLVQLAAAVAPPPGSPSGLAASNQNTRESKTEGSTSSAATPKARRHRSAVHRSLRRSERQKLRRKAKKKYADGRESMGRRVKLR